MLAQCFSLLFLLDSLVLTEVNMPYFNQSFLSAHLFNLSCTDVSVTGDRLEFSADNKSLGLAGTSHLTCTTDIEFFAYRGELHFDVFAEPGEVQVRSFTPADTCDTSNSVVGDCAVHLNVHSLYASPPSPLIDLGLAKVRQFLETNLQSYVCKVAVPRFQDMLTNHTMNPPLPSPPSTPGSVPLASYPLTRAINNIVGVLPAILGFRIQSAVVGSGSTVQLSVTALEDKHIHFNASVNANGADADAQPHPATWLGWVTLLRSVMSGIPTSESLVIPMLRGSINNASAQILLPKGTVFSLDVSVPDIRQSGEASAYDIPLLDGIIVSNMRVEDAGDVSRIVTNYVGPMVVTQANALINGLINSTATPQQERYALPPIGQAANYKSPPPAIIVTFLFASLVIGVSLVGLNVHRHMRDPFVKQVSLEAIKTSSIVIQDVVLCTAVAACAACFIWSNCTTAATVIVGLELRVYSFSMMTTVRDLWDSGLCFLSVCVFVFSGVYPYFKLASILFFTLVLKSPDAALLHIIDYIGKFSFLDTFVMLIMVGGLTAHGIADVEIHAPFYIFLAGTIGSIATGNYATNLWRRGTTIKHTRVETSPGGSEENESSGEGEADPLLAVASDPLAAAVVVVAAPRCTTWRFRVFMCAVVVCCSLPVWVWPCLRYRLGGIAPLVTGYHRSFSLYDLSLSTSPLCFVVTLIIVLIAPSVYALRYPTCAFIASWCAADVFVLACVAGLLQLNQFIQFVLGDGMENFYNAHADLLWPLIPLTLGAAVSWLLALSSILNIDLQDVITKTFLHPHSATGVQTVVADHVN